MLLSTPLLPGKDKAPGLRRAVQGPSARAGGSGAARLGGHHRHSAQRSVDGRRSASNGQRRRDGASWRPVNRRRSSKSCRTASVLCLVFRRRRGQPRGPTTMPSAMRLASRSPRPPRSANRGTADDSFSVRSASQPEPRRMSDRRSTCRTTSTAFVHATPAPAPGIALSIPAGMARGRPSREPANPCRACAGRRVEP